jgi:S-adenosylmethionine:tRNA ribosyltransferase-isomerase
VDVSVSSMTVDDRIGQSRLRDLSFEVPAHLEAGQPPEARGLARDQVRLMVSYVAEDRVVHTTFRELPSVLTAGDLLVLNTSGTLNAAVAATAPDNMRLELHLSTRLPGGLWVVELRKPGGSGTEPLFDVPPGLLLTLPAGGSATILAPHGCGCGRPAPGPGSRLWVASINTPGPLMAYLAENGEPIRYGYVKQAWPGSYYQSVYVTEMGSAEMPSAGRAFTPELITALIAGGIQVAPLLLHTGVASLESHEPPYEEYCRVPLATARLANAARSAGNRVIAVGTTVVRALETVTDPEGTVHPGDGWTCTVIRPETGVRSVDALLTGLHEPRSSHLMMLEALAGRGHLSVTYAEALREGYLWHEFGDLHLILP